MSGKSFSHSMFFKVGNIVFRICMVLSIVVSNLVLQTGTASAKGGSIIPQDLPEKNTIQNSIEGVDAFLDRANDNRHKNMMPVENENEQVFSEALLEESNYLLAPLLDAGVPDVSLSTLEISDPVKANGSEAITLTATILDENSDPVEGVEVLFNVSGGEVDISYQNTESDSNGQVIATVTSTKIGPKPVTAYIVGSGVDTDTVAIAQSGTAIFTGAIISGNVFLDNNRNGVMDGDESGILGITVDLLNGNDEVVASTQSVGDGVYQIEGLDAGTYKLAIEATQEYGVGTSEKTVALSAFENKTGQDFAVYTTSIVTGTIWDDVNHDEVMDETESMMEGVTVNLSGDAGSMSTETDENGEYSFGVETEHPEGPDNFSFESEGYVIDDDLSASIYNGDFEDEGYILEDSYFPENYDFETPGYVMDESYFPENYDFETPGYVMDDSYFPENYNFESGNLSTWETDNFVITTNAHDGSYAAYTPAGVSSNLISPAFTIPEEAQSLTWCTKPRNGEEQIIIFWMRKQMIFLKQCMRMQVQMVPGDNLVIISARILEKK